VMKMRAIQGMRCIISDNCLLILLALIALWHDPYFCLLQLHIWCFWKQNYIICKQWQTNRSQEILCRCLWFILQSRQSTNTFLEPFPSQKPEATNKCTCYVGPSANEIRRCCIVSFPWSDKSAYLVGFPGKGVQNYTKLCPLCFFPDSENG
jgi:hypothetical protein